MLHLSSRAPREPRGRAPPVRSDCLQRDIGKDNTKMLPGNTLAHGPAPTGTSHRSAAGGRLGSLRVEKKSPSKQQARRAARRFPVRRRWQRVGRHCTLHAKSRIPMTGRHRVWTSRNRVGREGACSSRAQAQGKCVKGKAHLLAFGPFGEKPFDNGFHGRTTRRRPVRRGPGIFSLPGWGVCLDVCASFLGFWLRGGKEGL